MSVLIRGGTVVTAEGALDADVLIVGEKIAAVLARGSATDAATFAAAGAAADAEPDADVLIDASGKYVIPGGIDGHTHMEMPFGGTFSVDTFETGTKAAAWGGTTTIIDFAVQAKGTGLLATLDKWHEKADGNCAIDYGFHMIVSDVNDATLKEMESCIGAGVTSFKMFMAYPGVFYATDGEILLAMQQASDQLVAQSLAAGRTDPVHHGLSRPPELEGEATSRAITLAGVANCPLYIVHLSAAQALAAVAAARDAGHNVFAETCPQYLYLSLDDLARPDFEGAKFVCSPPLRTPDHSAALWRGLRANDLSVVSTDHCPFCFKEQKELGRGDFAKIPNGMPGVEHRMDLLHQGVVAGEITLSRWVETCSTTPARMFGLYPRKGVIAPGADADIVVYDPAARQTLSVATHHMNVDYSAYEGMEITGKVAVTISRGRVVVADGEFRGSGGHGVFLQRDLNQYLV
jgi:dihydropyrimidinase